MIFDRYEKLTIGAILIMGGLIIACILYARYGLDATSIGMTKWNMIEHYPYNPQQDWTVLDPRWIA